MNVDAPRIAIAHEWLTTYGGSERVLVEMLKIFPQASLFALIHDEKNFCGTPLEGRAVRTSFLQKIPRVTKLYRALLPLMPRAIESLDLRGYDLVISLSHAVAHGLKTTRDQTHISYISTPMRYAWHMQDDYLRLHRLSWPPINFAARRALSGLRRWDISAAARADSLLANSAWTAGHIREYWGRESQVLYPPVDVERFNPAPQRDDFYLFVSRLVPYKRADEIVRAFNMLGLPLVIVGDGPELPKLKSLAKENIQLLGPQPDSVVADLMNRARAFVYMATEDFGIVMAEAQAAGCPVIAYAEGGAGEIVRDGETGLLFHEQSAEAMVEAVTQSRTMRFAPESARGNALRFSSERFRGGFLKEVGRA